MKWIEIISIRLSEAIKEQLINEFLKPLSQGNKSLREEVRV